MTTEEERVSPFTTLSDAEVFETPNAVMRTYASPSVNGSGLAVWRTEMAPGASGPVHALDTEQIVVVLSGRLTATVDGESRVLQAGDAVALPAGVERQFANPHDGPVVALSAALPGSVATLADRPPMPVPWAR